MINCIICEQDFYGYPTYMSDVAGRQLAALKHKKSYLKACNLRKKYDANQSMDGDV